MFTINQAQITTEQIEEMYQTERAFRVTNYKITPEQLEEIEAHLSRAAWILNSEELPDWENLQTACREIADAMQDISVIREKVK